MRILDRHVIDESLQILVVGTLCVLGIFFGTVEFTRVLELLNEFGLPLNTVLSIMLLQMPTGMTYCMPAGVMIATMFCMARQHADGEILALQISGVSLRRIFAPYLMVGLCGSVCAFVLGETVAPQTRLLSEKLVYLGMYNAERPFVGQSIVNIKNEAGAIQQLLMFGPGVGRSITGFLVLDLSQKGLVNLVWAEQGEWINGKWELKDGLLFDLLRKDDAGNRGHFEKLKVGNNSRLIKSIEAGPMFTLEKTTSQLRDEIEAYAKSGRITPSYILLQYYRRFANPMSCLFLVVAAAPLMVPSRRRGTSQSLAYGGILVVLYFLLQQLCVALADNQRLDLLVAAWLPGTLLFLVGSTLLFFRRKV